MKHKLIFFLLLFLTFITAALHLYKPSSVPPGFNVDEAAYGYNAYSLLKTGRDEFGKSFPLLRLQSFGDFKLPMYTYLSVPTIALLGLNEFAVRLPAIIAIIALVWVMYALSKELFDSRLAGVIAATLTAVSPGLNILARHAHEAVPTTLFLASAFLFLLRFGKHKKMWDALLFILFVSIGLYTYHIARVFYVFFGGVFAYYVFKERIKLQKLIVPALVAILFVAPFLYAEVTTPPSRLGTLFILNHGGIDLIAAERKIEFARSPFSQRLFVAGDEIMRRYVGYFSTDFLIYNGDPNERFGFKGMGPINVVEYLAIFVGLFYIFKKKRNAKTTILILLALIAPLPAALTWQEYAMNRAYFMLVPLLLLASFGLEQLYQEKLHYKKYILGIIAFVFVIYTAQRWTTFFYHYPRRATVVRAWQGGYKELMMKLKAEYNNYDKMYITRDIGQPYIFVLFYFPYDPVKYQLAVSTTKPDEYGYTQVDAFDKFVFNTQDFEKNRTNKKILYVMSETEGKGYTIPPEKIEKIKIETEDMFWIVRP